MQLYDNPASPFCRKVRVLAIELGKLDEIEMIHAVGHPLASEKMPTGHNPLGKIPCLIDGKPIYDSRVICRYLDAKWDGGRYPQDRLFKTLITEAMADGIMEAAVSIVYEARCRDEAMRSGDWVEAQWAKIARALDQLETITFGEQFEMDQIAVACALGYLDFRMPERAWRDGHPLLADWYNTRLKHTSLAQTIPTA